VSVAGLVAREAELALVEGFLDAADARFEALVLEGEAGIGKTTVWIEACRRAGERGMLVLSCRPSATEAKFSFAGVSDLLSPLDPAAFEPLPAPLRNALDVALLRAEPGEGTPLPRAVASGFLALVRRLSASAPLLLAVDDAQWLDAPSRGVIEFAARRLEDDRVGLVYSLRTPASRPPIGSAVAVERLRRLNVGAMSLAALGRILKQRLGRSTPRPLLVRISEASGGNPFYALEIARLMTEAGGYVAGSALPVPDDLRALTAARIRRLPREAREALLLAAVLSAPDSGSVKLAALAPAEEEGMVRVDDGGRIVFDHPLFASAAYSSIATSRRRALHRRAAELCSDPEQRARHLALGTEGSDPTVAHTLDEAAAQAGLRGAPDAAAELAELAAKRSARGDPERVKRLLRAAQLHFDAGDLSRADTLVQEVLAGSSPDRVRALALQLSAQLHGRRSNFTEAAALADAALAAAGADDTLRSAIELDLAFCAASLGSFPDAAQHARAAVAHAEASDERGLLADALAALTMTEFLWGRGLDQDRLARALALEDPLWHGTFVMHPRYIRGILQLWTGELAGALDTLGALHDEVVVRGQEGVVPLLFLYLVWACLWRGELERADRLSRQALDAAALLEDPTATAIGLAASALVHAHSGPSEAVRAEAAEALAIFSDLQWRSGAIWPLWALGLAELSQGDAARAEGHLGPLADLLGSMGAGDPILGVFLPDAIEALAALGDGARARAYLEPFEHKARELDRGWALAAAARCEGAIATAEGEHERAFGAFERSSAEYERLAMPFERARTLLLEGQARRRLKQRGLARSAFDEALAAFERLGAAPWAARARSERDRLGGRPSASDGLTATERRLATLAATGLTNREVAERAFVSVKTVESNLTRVYRKLGVRSRVGLAQALDTADGSGDRRGATAQS
jgi:DNA-binding CsgD family transcriptional regulator